MLALFNYDIFYSNGKFSICFSRLFIAFGVGRPDNNLIEDVLRVSYFYISEDCLLVGLVCIFNSDMDPNVDFKMSFWLGTPLSKGETGNMGPLKSTLFSEERVTPY